MASSPFSCPSPLLLSYGLAPGNFVFYTDPGAGLLPVVITSLALQSIVTGRLLPLLALVSSAAFIIFSVSSLFATIQWYAEKYKTAHRNEQIIRDNEAKLERLVKSLNDYERYLRITNDELVIARDEAEKARHVKQIFVQNVSHELRTPLNLIIGFSETMINTPENYGGVNWTPELKGDLECIYQNSQHLKSLIDDVLDLAALENKKHEVVLSEVDLNSLINETILISQGSVQRQVAQSKNQPDRGKTDGARRWRQDQAGDPQPAL